MRTYLGIALISAAMLLLELALLRVFAVQQFYHSGLTQHPMNGQRRHSGEQVNFQSRLA